MLLWDGLGGHTSRRMHTYLASQRAWLTVERLPAYAPELNPVEPMWGNVKTRGLANHCAPDLEALGRRSTRVSRASAGSPTSPSRSCATPG